MNLIECYDIGGTNLRGAIFDSEADKILTEKIIETKKGNIEIFLKQIKDVSDFLRANVNSNDIKNIVLGVPGPVENNIILGLPPLQIKEKIDIISKLTEIGVKQNIYALNDIDAAVLAEKHFGEGQDLKSLCLVTISTGIGAGTIIDGKIIPGGEYGHNILERDGPICSCGRKGCWVALSSGYAIEKAAEKIYGRKISSKEFFKLYEFGDKKVKELVKKIRDYNAHGFGNIVNAVCVDKIIIMGSVGLEQFDKIIPSKEEIKAYAINKIPDIVSTKLGKNIGLLGAYVFGKNKLE